MERNSVAASFMLSLWNGTARVQLSPTLTAETRHLCSEICAPPSLEPQDTWPSIPSTNRSAGSRTCSILSGNDAATNSNSVSPSLNASSVGDLPVKISSSVIPKL